MKTENEKWDKFKQLWASEFNKTLSEKDGEAYWLKFVSEVKHNSMLEEAVRLLSDQYHANKKCNSYTKMPGLYDLREMYFILVKKDREPVRGNCSMCNNCGSVTVVQIWRGNLTITCDPKRVVEVLKTDKIGVFAGPCTCGAGDSKYPQKYRNECVRNKFGSANGETGNEYEYIEKCKDYNRGTPALDGNQT